MRLCEKFLWKVIATISNGGMHTQWHIHKWKTNHYNRTENAVRIYNFDVEIASQIFVWSMRSSKMLSWHFWILFFFFIYTFRVAAAHHHSPAYPHWEKVYRNYNHQTRRYAPTIYINFCFFLSFFFLFFLLNFKCINCMVRIWHDTMVRCI